MPLEKLNRERIVQALNLLGELAEREQVGLEICLYGGSALLLAFGAREGTKDVDAIIRPWETANRLAQQVAERLNLNEHWLNSDVRRYVSNLGTYAPLQIEELEDAAKRHLKISRPSASYLLAMKCLAGRPSFPGHSGDLDDIKFLIRKMGIRSLDQIQEHIDRFYPGDAMSTQTAAAAEAILKEA